MRRAIVGMLVTFLLFSMLNVMSNVMVVAASPRIIKVPRDYQKIKWAVGNASAGDTIIVSEGTYEEGQINVNKSLTLMANGTVMVDGLQEGHVFYVTADYVNITGFTVTHARRSASCIFLKEVQHCNVSRNRLINSSYGIKLQNSIYNNIAKNNVTNNDSDGVVDLYDIVIVNVAYGSQRDLGDPWPPGGDWDSRADLNCDGIIDSSDLAIVSANYGNVYK